MCLGIPAEAAERATERDDLAKADVKGRARHQCGAARRSRGGIGDWVLVYAGFAMAKTG